MFAGDLLYYIEGPLTQSLSYRVEEDKDEITELRQPENALVDIEWVAHVSVHQTRRVDEGDQGELFLFRCGDLSGQIVSQVGHLGQRFEVRVEMQSGVASQRFSLLARRNKGEALSLDGDPSPLHVLLDVPVDEGGLPGRMVSWGEIRD